MRRLRKFLIGVIALVVSAVSVMGGGVLAMDVYAEPIGPITKPDENSSTDTEDGASNGGADAEGAAHNLKECKTGDGKPALCEDSADGGTTMYPLPDGFSASDLPKDYKGDINEFFEAWKKAKDGDNKDIENLYPGWSEHNYTPTQGTIKENDAIEDIKDSCSGAGGAKSLGWIVCPIMSFFGSAADGVYNKLLEPLLEVDPALFTGGSGDTSTNVTREQGWGTFRDIGNGIVIVMLLVVIFSQLTGVGIDNYGIKKVLPKIVVAAILMNLSYWICVAFVDVSNILGRGLKDMFNFLADGSNLVLDTSDMENGGTANLTAAGNTFVSAAVLSAMVGGAGVMIWSNPALVLTLLIAAIGIVVAVFFLFILFAVREAAILVLVVVSPVAIALYMLPNTKSVFDKWLKLFEGMLLVYPVSGLLIGAGNFVSRLLLSGGMSSSGFFATFTSMIVGIVPVFFIPSMLKSSFSAMGKIGTKISGIGNDIGRRAQKVAGNSAAYKNAQVNAFERSIARRAGIRRDGTRIEDMNMAQRIIRGGRRNIARAAGAYVRNEQMRANEEAFLRGGGMEAGLAGIQAGVDAQMMKNAQSMLEYSRLNEDGSMHDPNNMDPDAPAAVNTNSIDSMRRFHANAIRNYQHAETDDERNNIMAQIRAVQNLMSTTDKGRSAVQKNYEDALRDGDTAALGVAASHIMSSFGNQYKSANRGAHAMIQDLSSMTSNDDLAAIRSRIGQVDDEGHVLMSGEYGRMGTDKYTAESLVNADDAAIDRLIAGVNDGSLQGKNLADIQSTAYEALAKQRAGTLNIKPEIADKLRNGLLRGYVHVNNDGTNQPVPDGYGETGSGIILPNH